MKNLVFPILLIVCLLSTNVTAQTGNSAEARGGSIYSSIGVGYPVDVTSAGLKAQGILGLTNINRETSSLANPGLWASTFYSQASTGLQLTRAEVESSASTGTNVNLQTGYLHLLFPLKPGKIGMSVGMYPVTRANFKSVNTKTFNSTANTELEYTNEVQSFGGINKFEVGFAFKLGENFSIGYAPSIAFLTLKNSEALDFNVSGFADHSQEIDYNGNAFAQRFGFTGTFKSVLRETDTFSFGGTLNLPYTIDAKRTFSAIKNVRGAEQEVTINGAEDQNGDIDMPMEASFGIGYSPSNLFNLAVEAELQKWSDFSNTLDPSSQELMNDRKKIGFGGQYHPYRKNLDTFLSGFKYAAGISYDTGHLNILDQNIETLWLNTGFGIPSKVASFVDFSFQYGFRGTTDNNLFKERIWTVGMSVNLTELMFVRPKLR
ncbi:MAG: hypothetical protein JJ895_13045 [Balneolaceae bacterium]|nr:hypothetical protein [Balneolaceae bacterium]